MKKNLFILLSLFAANAFAYEGFRCNPSMRETRIEVLVKEEMVQLTVINPAGYKFMPQFSSPGSVFNLAYFKMQAEDLAPLGEKYYYSWPKEKCQLDSKKFILNCQGEAAKDVNEIKSYGVSTTEILERYQGKVYEKRRFRQSLDIGNIYFVDIEYHTQNCEMF